MQDLKESHENGAIIYLGEHNFTDLEVSMGILLMAVRRVSKKILQKKDNGKDNNDSNVMTMSSLAIFKDVFDFLLSEAENTTNL